MSSDLWVASRLTNGLGNRLFQLAAAHSASILWNRTLVFAMQYCLPSEHGDFDSIFKLFPFVKKLWKAEPEILYEHTGASAFEYSPFPSIAPANTLLLKGPWIAAKYIHEDFKVNWQFAIPDSTSLLERWCLLTQEQQEKTVFLHVRLGDYCILPHHQVNLLTYYVKAMESFSSDTRFLIFSDTLDKARSLPVFDERCVFVQEDNELNTLYLMSCCNGGITANSTFSFWGLFFGRQRLGESYKGYMPDRWMASNEDTSDLYPSWVTRISVS